FSHRSLAQRAFWASAIFLRVATENLRLALGAPRTFRRPLAPTSFSNAAIASSKRLSSFSVRLLSPRNCFSSCRGFISYLLRFLSRYIALNGNVIAPGLEGYLNTVAAVLS